jgi:hypothetical protein
VPAKKKKRKFSLGDIPGWQDGDLVVVAKDGTVVPLCAEVLGCDWETIRAKLSGIDHSTLPKASDIPNAHMKPETVAASPKRGGIDGARPNDRGPLILAGRARRQNDRPTALT